MKCWLVYGFYDALCRHSLKQVREVPIHWPDSWFLIVGCQRSGTTMLRLILECHSALQCHELERRGLLNDVRAAAHTDTSELVRVLEYRDRLRRAAASGADRPPVPENLTFDLSHALQTERLRGLPMETLIRRVDWFNPKYWHPITGKCLVVKFVKTCLRTSIVFGTNRSTVLSN
jgi:hypothetical protein